MNSQKQQTTATFEEEEERQPNVAPTVIMSEPRGSCKREITIAESQKESSAYLPADDDKLDAGPSREDLRDLSSLSRKSTSNDRTSFLLDVRCPTSLECVVDPVTFPGEPFDAGMNLERSHEDSDETAAAPETKEMVISDPITIKSGKRRRKRRRKMDTSDSENDLDIGVDRQLRPRKSRVLEESATEEKRKPPPAQLDIPPSAMETTTGEVEDTQPTDVDSTAQKKKKLSKKKSFPIAPKMHPLIDVDNLTDHTTANMIALAMDWLDDINVIRKKCNMQGVISKFTKQRLELLQKVLRIVHDQSLRPDNLHQLQMRNARLLADNLATQKENNQLKAKIVALERSLRDTRASYEIQKE